MRSLLVLIAFVFALILSFFFWVEHRFHQKKYVFELPLKASLWQHKGDQRTAAANSLQAFKLALDAGASGIEVDVYYDAKLDKFVVSYRSPPYEQLNDGLLFLQDVFNSFGDKTFYWIDFKNLTRANSEAALARIQSLLNSDSLTERVFVESTRGYLLRDFTQAGVKTLYLLNPGSGGLSRFLRTIIIKSTIAFSNFSAVSTDIDLIDEAFIDNYKHLPWFIFTVNSTEEFQVLQSYDNVHVILTDGLLF